MKIIEQFSEVRENPLALDELRPEFRFAKIKPTNNCNSKCITCTYWENTYNNELTLEEVFSVLRDLRESGVEDIMFTGGEPTLRNDLSKMVAEAASLGFDNICLTTNGLSLGDSKRESLLEAGLTEIVLSLEGLSEHDTIRGIPGNRDKILHQLNQLKDDDRVVVKVATTLMSHTLREVPALLDLARQSKAMLFFNLIDRGTYFFKNTEQDLFTIVDLDKYDALIDDLIAVKHATPDLLGNTVESLEYARRYFRDPKQAQIPCYLGYIGVEVDADGSVYTNCWGLPSVGNIREKPFSEIIHGEAYRKNCRAMYLKQCAGCSCGYILNMSCHTSITDN